MSDLREAMQLIGGIEPTPQQMQRVQAIAHSLGIPNNDAMMPILIALDTYHGAFKELPAKAQAAADTSAQAAANRSTVLVNEAVAAAVTKLGPKVGDAIVKVANDIHKVDKTKWVGGVVVVVALVFSALGWITHASGYSSGFETGKAEGIRIAEDEKAAAAWANTGQGRMAYRLAQAGSIEMLARCTGKGWEFDRDGTCTPMPVENAEKKKQMYGWKVGADATANPVRRVNVSWLDRLFSNDA